MKAATYKITGSLSYKQTGEFGSMSSARANAREANQRTADGRMLSFRAYKKRSDGDEGWTVAGKIGLDGQKIGC